MLYSPINKFNVFHIAGTKGSASASTESVIRRCKPHWKIGESLENLNMSLNEPLTLPYCTQHGVLKLCQCFNPIQALRS